MCDRAYKQQHPQLPKAKPWLRHHGYRLKLEPLPEFRWNTTPSLLVCTGIWYSSNPLSSIFHMFYMAPMTICLKACVPETTIFKAEILLHSQPAWKHGIASSHYLLNYNCSIGQIPKSVIENLLIKYVSDSSPSLVDAKILKQVAYFEWVFAGSKLRTMGFIPIVDETVDNGWKFHLYITHIYDHFTKSF